MRQLQAQEVSAVSGAGILTNVLTTGAQAGTAAGSSLIQAGAVAGSGLVQAGTIVGAPLATTTVRVLKFLI